MIKVAQCWDDGVSTDIRLIEILRKYNAKATFNICLGYHADTRQEAHWVPKEYSGFSYKGFIGGRLSKHELSEVYSGFKVASHCMRHGCAGQISDDIFIKAALDGCHFSGGFVPVRMSGFAWPCEQYTPSTADALRAAGFKYGRTTKNVNAVWCDVSDIVAKE